MTKEKDRGLYCSKIMKYCPFYKMIIEEEQDRIFKKLGEKIDGVVLNSLRKQLKGDKK